MLNPEVSIVIPVYRSEETLPELVRRIHQACNELGRTEIVFVDDCSPDDSWEVLMQLRDQYPKLLKLIRLGKNSGQHNAIVCGFSYAEGQVVVTMDDDLQNPPEEIKKLVRAVQDGFDMAVGDYQTKQHAGHRNFAGRIVDSLLRWQFRLPPTAKLTSFRAVRREVVKKASAMSGVFPYVTAMLLTHATSFVNIPVDHQPRASGRSNYSLRRSFLLLANLLFSYTLVPVFFVASCCAAGLFVSMIYATIVFLRALFLGSSVPGWASTIIILTFFSNLILMSLVVFGVYLARMSRQVNQVIVPYVISELHD